MDVIGLISPKLKIVCLIRLCSHLFVSLHKFDYYILKSAPWLIGSGALFFNYYSGYCFSIESRRMVRVESVMRK